MAIMTLNLDLDLSEVNRCGTSVPNVMNGLVLYETSQRTS